MQYELRGVKLVGNFTNNPDGVTGIQSTSVTSGVVGDTYGFVKVDDLKVTLLKSDSITVAEGKIQTAAAAFVAATYPNT